MNEIIFGRKQERRNLGVSNVIELKKNLKDDGN